METSDLGLTAAAELLRTRHVSSVELTEAVFARIDRIDGYLHSYALTLREGALAQARDADSEIFHGRYRGPLHGIPIGLKDLIDVAGVPTAAGGIVHAGAVASTDATVVARLRAAGAVITGKLTMTEGAFSDHHPDLPTPVNPWDADTWFGSSSSGSAIAVATGLCFGSLGSDTGGSIRLPSSMNGVTGVKPTWGRVSRAGTFELAGSLDHIGPIARSAADAAAILGVIAGSDSSDPTASLAAVPDYLGGLGREQRFRLAIDRALLETFDDETRAMLGLVEAVARDLGWAVVEVRLPEEFATVAADWAEICGVEAAVAHADTYPSHASAYGPEMAGLIELGREVSAARLHQLQVRRRAFTGRMLRAFESFDLLLLPGIGKASPTLAQMADFSQDPELFAAILVPTAPLDLCGFPSVTLPGGFTDRGTPLGFQLAAAPFDENVALRAAHAFQRATEFHLRRPPILGGIDVGQGS